MKTDRHARIIELVNERDIETQEELADLLRREGFNVTQATVSRDIRELKLTKVAYGAGHQKYGILHHEDVYADRYIRILKEAYVSMDTAGNMLVIRTVSGMAMAAAAALDAMHLPGFVGCIAGDNTIMVAVKTPDEAVLMMEQIKKLAL